MYQEILNLVRQGLALPEVVRNLRVKYPNVPLDKITVLFNRARKELQNG